MIRKLNFLGLIVIITFLLTACGGGGGGGETISDDVTTSNRSQFQTLSVDLNSNWQDIVNNQLGSDYEVADWDKLKDYIDAGGSINALLNSIAANNADSYFIYKSGLKNQLANSLSIRNQANSVGGYYALYVGDDANNPIETLSVNNRTVQLIALSSPQLLNIKILVLAKTLVGIDPLFKYQWHLSKKTNDIEAFNYAGSTTIFNVITTDTPFLNLPNEWSENILSGEGVKVAIIDHGVDINHPDLKANINTNLSCDFGSNTDGICADKNPSPDYPIISEDVLHGTMVAGITGAAKNNNIGVAGLAPKVELISMNYLDNQGFINLLSAINANADINNESYGYSTGLSYLYSDDLGAVKLIEAYQDQVINGRDGKGKIFAKASGNSFAVLNFETTDEDDNLITITADCNNANTYQVSCENSNIPFDQPFPYYILTAALNHQDKKTWYSSAGSNVWISTYGGDNLYILTTTIQGEGNDLLNDNNKNYTQNMNGTSASTPMTSGIVALMLETNPNLTWREIKYILAKTAIKVDIDIAQVSTNTVVIRDNWIKNKADFNFHNWYGFGKVDTKAAIQMANEYKNSATNYPRFDSSLPSQSFDFTNSITINPQSTNSFDFHITDNIRIEAVQLEIIGNGSGNDDDALSNLNIRLSSSSGTKSILLNLFNGFITDNLRHLFLSNAFYMESAQNTWTVEIYNHHSTESFNISSAKLIIFGG